LCYLFEDFVLDTDRRELRRGTDVVPTTPQVFDLLNYLIRHKDQVVSKDDLISAVWNGRIVSDAALTTRMNAARAAIGDDGDKQRLIKTLPRKGVRFVGEVQERQSPATAGVRSAQNDDATQRPFSPPHLSMVVLPFVNLSGDPEQDYFVDGVTESLTTDLSRIKDAFVIGRHTAFAYKGEARDLKKIGRELNVRYVLEGSVQRSGKRFRVNVQLIDTETANHIWAERFDKLVADLFDTQDEIVSLLANALNAQLIEAEAQRAQHSVHPDATDLTFQGFSWSYKGPTLEYVAQARVFFERALEIDPRSFRALVGMARVHLAMGAGMLANDRAAQLLAAETNAIKAVSLAPDYPWAHLALGGALIFSNRAARGIAEFEQVLRLDRNAADAHAYTGLAKVFLGRSAETEAHVVEAFRLSPRDIAAYQWMHIAGTAKLQLGADAEAVTWLQRSIDANRNFPLTHFILAAALGLLGEMDEARSAAKAGLALQPDFTISRLRAVVYSDNATYLAARERVCEGLRLAGVPQE
jgi:TolB-like protein/tetratricopeptide (TPR) repeat protein